MSGCLPKILSVNGLITSEQSPGMTNNAAAQTPANLKLCFAISDFAGSLNRAAPLPAKAPQVKYVGIAMTSVNPLL